MKQTLFTSNFKRVVSVIAVVAITLFMVSKISFLLENKTTYENYATFIKSNEDYDVLFLGSSHVRYGFYPMELWEDYGITSYNLSGDANTIPVSYWVLKQALKYHKPKTVVLDIYDCSPNDIVYLWEFALDSTGVYPLSFDKIKMVLDLSRNPEWTDGFGNRAGTRWGLAFKIAEYHDRWSSLNSGDYKSYSEYIEKSRIRKGAKIRTYIEATQFDTCKGDPEAKYDVIAREYLERIIKICEENGIELLLINTGYNGNDEMVLFADSIPDIANENGLKYLDYTDMNIIDYACDFQTNAENTHVNVSGAIKLTRHLGKYLIDNELAIDHRNEDFADIWNEDCKRYRDYMNNELDSLELFEESIEVLYGSRYDVVIDIYDDSILDERSSRASLANLGVDISKVKSKEEILIRKGEVVIDPILGFSYLQDIQYKSLFDDVSEGRAKVTVIDPIDGRLVLEKTF